MTTWTAWQRGISTPLNHPSNKQVPHPCSQSKMSTASSDVEEEVSAPVVFQCFKCNLVVGDSFAFRCADRDRQTITLSAASNITRTSDIYTSSSKFDYGSTYITFNCLGCEVIICMFFCVPAALYHNFLEYPRKILFDDLT